MPKTEESTQVDNQRGELVKKASPSGKYTYANGKRKTAVAKVRLYKGEGEITVNGKDLKEYFGIKSLYGLIKAPLKLTGNAKNFNISAMIQGGGSTAQADALRHGIAKALVELDEKNKLILKKEGFLTRDDRTKERKKPGLKRARKSGQFSKR